MTNFNLFSGASSLIFGESLNGGAFTTYLTLSSNGLTLNSGNLTVSTGSISCSTGLAVGGSNVISSTRLVTVADGTFTAPSFSFGSDTNTGMYRITTDTIGFTTAGSEKVRISSAGNVSIGNINNTHKLEVNGDIKLSETSATIDTDKFAVLDSGVIKFRTGTQVLSDLGVPSTSQDTNAVGSYSAFGQPYAPGGGTAYDVDATASGTSFFYTPTNNVNDFSALAPSGTWKFRSPMPSNSYVALVQRIA